MHQGCTFSQQIPFLIGEVLQPFMDEAQNLSNTEAPFSAVSKQLLLDCNSGVALRCNNFDFLY